MCHILTQRASCCTLVLTCCVPPTRVRSNHFFIGLSARWLGAPCARHDGSIKHPTRVRRARVSVMEHSAQCSALHAANGNLIVSARPVLSDARPTDWVHADASVPSGETSCTPTRRPHVKWRRGTAECTPARIHTRMRVPSATNHPFQFSAIPCMACNQTARSPISIGHYRCTPSMPQTGSALWWQRRED